VPPLPRHFKYHPAVNVKYNIENANNIRNDNSFSLFNDAVSSSDYTASTDMTNE
jgi:hypothetical protein